MPNTSASTTAHTPALSTDTRPQVPVLFGFSIWSTEGLPALPLDWPLAELSPMDVRLAGGAAGAEDTTGLGVSHISHVTNSPWFCWRVGFVMVCCGGVVWCDVAVWWYGCSDNFTHLE